TTATRALTNATLPYVSAIAAKGWERAASDDAALAKGLNVQGGRIDAGRRRPCARPRPGP
ncbi:hypothetical protein CTI14_66245, partial [Methylobacterium radiotolerans]